MLKVVKNKVLFVGLIVAMVLLSSACFCVLNWSYLVDCTLSIDEVQISWLQKGVHCYGTTMVDGYNYAEVIVYLQQLDEDGDWINIAAWDDMNEEFAAVDLEYPVDPGTYRVKTTHRAYTPDDLDLYAEKFSDETDPITID